MDERAKSFLRSVLAVAFGVVASTVTAQEMTKIRFASVGGITDAPIYLAEDMGLFQRAGLSIDLQRMTSAPNLMTAVATNQLDVAGISITPGLYSSVAQGMNLRIVGDKQSLSPGISATRLLIRTDLSTGREASDIAALKGKKIAVSAKASSVYMLLEKLLKKHGLALSDVNIVELAYPNMLPAFTSKAIDAAISLEPFMSQTLQDGVAKLTSDLTEFVPKEGATIVPIVYSEEFARRKDQATAFMKVYMQGVRIYNDAFVKGKDKQRVIEVIARGAKIKPEVVSEGFPAGLDPNQAVSEAFLSEVQDFFFNQKFLRAKIDVARIVDHSFAEAAMKELGPYK